jgi:hypothetical protein
MGISIVKKPNNQFEEKTSLFLTLSIMGIDCSHTIVHDWFPHKIEILQNFEKLLDHVEIIYKYPTPRLNYGF